MAPPVENLDPPPLPLRRGLKTLNFEAHLIKLYAIVLAWELYACILSSLASVALRLPSKRLGAAFFLNATFAALIFPVCWSHHSIQEKTIDEHVRDTMADMSEVASKSLTGFRKRRDSQRRVGLAGRAKNRDCHFQKHPERDSC